MRNNTNKGKAPKQNPRFRNLRNLIGPVPAEDLAPAEVEAVVVNGPDDIKIPASITQVEPPQVTAETPLSPESEEALDAALQGDNNSAKTSGEDELQEIPEGFKDSLVPPEERKAQEELAQKQAEIKASLLDRITFDFTLYSGMEINGQPRFLPLDTHIARLYERKDNTAPVQAIIEKQIHDGELQLVFGFSGRQRNPLRFLSPETGEAVMKEWVKFVEDTQQEIAKELEALDREAKRAASQAEQKAAEAAAAASGPVAVMDPQELCDMVMVFPPEEREEFLVEVFRQNPSCLTATYLQSLLNVVKTADKPLFRGAFAKSLKLGATPQS